MANLPSHPDPKYEAGMAVRRAVLGDQYVDQVLARTTAWSQDIQELVTRYAWGEVWSRPGLPRATRSLINLAMLTALNRPQEFKVHVAGAIRNGVSVAEIREVLLQTAIYCGLPAALESFRWAEEALRELGVPLE
ncbi:MAG: carboxymuconolactone decarboxylase family protein [Firmicutes bacterium]|nr:carboxymuconolactone decarboxylase family protein [Bacillota bacterium]